MNRTTHCTTFTAMLLICLLLPLSAFASESVELRFPETQLTLSVGQALSFPIEATGTVAPIYSSDNEAVLTIASDGTLHAHAVGTANIYASAVDCVPAVCMITVNEGESRIASISMTETLRLELGESFALTVVCTPAECAEAVNFSSSAPSVAFVDEYGVVRALSVGSCRITAKSESGNASAVCSVIVSESRKPTSIYFTTDNLTLHVGDRTDKYFVFTPANADLSTVSFTSSDKSVAAVDSAGMITARSFGAASVTAVCEGNFIGVCSILVVERMESLAFAFDTLTLDIGECVQLSPLVTPRLSYDGCYVYDSDNADTATVDKSGMLTAKAEGTAVITVKSTTCQLSAQFTLTVVDLSRAEIRRRRGDVTNDGLINAADLTMLLKHYGTRTQTCDINGDGIVNAADLTALLNNYGESSEE